VKDGVGGGACWGVMHNGLQQGFVQLGLVEATKDEQDVGADALVILKQFCPTFHLLHISSSSEYPTNSYF